jgi:hypothetical protein
MTLDVRVLISITFNAVVNRRSAAGGEMIRRAAAGFEVIQIFDSFALLAVLRIRWRYRGDS